MEMRCKNCGYDLRGQETHRCPECGRDFDPDDVRTFLTKPESGTRYINLAVLSGALFALPFIYIALVGKKMIPTTGIPRLLIPLVVVTSVFGFLISMHVIGQGRKAMRGKLPWISNRSGFNVAMIICGVIYVGGIAYSLWQLLIRW